MGTQAMESRQAIAALASGKYHFQIPFQRFEVWKPIMDLNEFFFLCLWGTEERLSSSSTQEGVWEQHFQAL